jgi:arylsulfatase A-like enzyme
VPDTQPWFLTFAPSAPHSPWTPAPIDAGRFADATITSPSLDTMNDVDGSPPWVRALPPIDAAEAAALDRDRRRMLESLGAVDRAIGELLAEVEARGELAETLVVVLADNGFSFGEHRWVGKRCPYAACVRTPLVVRSPWGGAGTVTAPVTNLDVAPTIVDLAGLSPTTSAFDGRSLRSLLEGVPVEEPEREGVLVGWVGDDEVPAWRGVRTAAFSYVAYDDGTVELFDVAGEIGPPDPAELDDRSGDPAYAAVRARLETLLSQMLSEAPRPAGA